MGTPYLCQAVSGALHHGHRGRTGQHHALFSPFDGGHKPRREMAVERQRQEQDALRKRIADRPIRRTRAKNAGVHKYTCFSSNHPVYLAIVFLSIFLTGLSAMYLVERTFLYYR